MNLLKHLLFSLLILLSLSACKKNLPDVSFPANTNFVSATLVASLNKSDLEAKASKGGFATFASLLKYDVDYFRIIYKTKYKNNDIQVSGLIGIPKNLSKFPSLLSVHHAEITRFADAPSNFPVSFNGIELFASAGFIEMIPDYIGLGISSSIPQPYYNNDYSGLTVVDMIKATKYFLEKKKISYNSKLFLAGFAEGGFVTTRAQYLMETDSSQNLTVTASAEGGGVLFLSPYFQLRSPAMSNNSPMPFFLPMLLNGFYETYDWSRPLTDYVSPTFATRLPSFFDGTKTIAQINAEISASPQDFLYNPLFEQYPWRNSSLYAEFNSVVQKNSLPYSETRYIPKAQSRFYLDTPDGITTSASLLFIVDAFGFPRYSNISFRTVDRMIPSTGQPMLLDAMQWFIELDK